MYIDIFPCVGFEATDGSMEQGEGGTPISAAPHAMTQGAKAVSSYMKNLRDYLKKAQLVT
jgi:hypothetical protein